MKRFVAAFLILGFLTVFNGCKNASRPSSTIPEIEPAAAGSGNFGASGMGERSSAEPFEITGTVVHKSLEGGFFAIDGDDGKKYNPINLPESFRKDGLTVKVTARSVDAMSIHMYGEMIDVVAIEIAAK